MYVKSETGVEFESLSERDRVKYAMAAIARALRQRDMSGLYLFKKLDELPSSEHSPHQSKKADEPPTPSSEHPLSVEGNSTAELLYLWTAAMVFGRDSALKFNDNAIRGVGDHYFLNFHDQKGVIARFSSDSLYEKSFKKYVTSEMLKIPTAYEVHSILALEKEKKKEKEAKDKAEAVRAGEMKEQEDEIQRQEQERLLKAGELKRKESQRQEDERRRREEAKQSERLAEEKAKNNKILLERSGETQERVRISSISDCLDGGADVDACDTKGNTALMIALDCQNDHVAEFLLKKGANTLCKNKSRLMPIDFVSSSSPLFTLIKEKMKEDALRQETAQVREMRLNKEFHEEVDGIAPKVRKIKALLDSGAKINYQSEKDGYTALMLAVDGQNDRVVEYLLTLGANPLLRNKSGEMASNLASQSSSIYQLLKGYEFLVATNCNDKPTTTALLQVDQSLLDFRGPQGYTGLLLAVERGFFELVESYLSMGAYLFAMCDDGKGVFELSTDDQITQLLHEYKTQSEIQMQDVQDADAEPQQPFVSDAPVSNFFPGPPGFVKK